MASLQNIVVVGGVSKLLSCISDPLISYANRRYSVGKAYSNCGLLHSHDSPPGFQYTFSGIIVGSRHNFQKHKLDKLLTNYNADWSEWENMKANGYNRIWDCGNLVFTRK